MIALVAAAGLAAFAQATGAGPSRQAPSPQAPSRQAPSRAADAFALVAAEKAWVAALGRRDRAAVDALLAPGFTDTTWTGAVRDRTAALDAVAGLPQGASESLSNLSVRVDGDLGVVSGANRVAGRTPQPVVVRFVDVFVRMDGAWRPIAAQETLVRTP